MEVSQIGLSGLLVTDCVDLENGVDIDFATSHTLSLVEETVMEPLRKKLTVMREIVHEVSAFS